MTSNELHMFWNDFAELEMRTWAYFLVENKKAKRLPARLRKKLYGKRKQPYTIIHDCITHNRGEI